jgi:hypothetical protein
LTLTDNCDIYVAIHEDGINRVLYHIRRQRPSLFNYGTVTVAQDKTLWCSIVDFTRDVQRYGNPIFKVVDAIPILGADSPPVGLNFCAQLTEAKIDLHPGNTISLPSELNPPIEKQHFSLKFKVCVTINCPYDDIIRRIQPKVREEHKPEPPIILPGKPNCFCLDVFVIGHFELVDMSGREVISGWVDEMDIVDIKPEELEENVICYLRTTLNVLFRERLFIPIEKLSLSFPLFNVATVTLFPTPNPPIPNNPAIGDDQLKAFINMTVI